MTVQVGDSRGAIFDWDSNIEFGEADIDAEDGEALQVGFDIGDVGLLIRSAERVSLEIHSIDEGFGDPPAVDEDID